MLRRMVELADKNTYLAKKMTNIVAEYDANSQEMTAMADEYRAFLAG